MQHCGMVAVAAGSNSTGSPSRETNESSRKESREMTTIVCRALTGCSVALFAFTCVAVAQPMPKTTKEATPGQATVKAEQLKGTVIFVEGNRLVVRMANSEIRNFDVPES